MVIITKTVKKCKEFKGLIIVMYAKHMLKLNQSIAKFVKNALKIMIIIVLGLIIVLAKEIIKILYICSFLLL